MRIALGNDHRGVALKQSIAAILQADGHEPVDLGTVSSESVDYPDYGVQVARGVGDGIYDIGILICGTGIGMSMVANKVKGVRAALVNNVEQAKMSRTHNNANILVLGEHISAETGAEITRSFLQSTFEGGRHERRVQKIHELTGC